MGRHKRALLPKMQTISNKLFKPENMGRVVIVVRTDGSIMFESIYTLIVPENFLKR